MLYVIYMYKTISVDEKTFILLDRVSSRLDKPKAQTVSFLLDFYEKQQLMVEKRQTDTFHAEMKQLIDKISLPKGTRVDSVELSRDLSDAYAEEA